MNLGFRQTNQLYSQTFDIYLIKNWTNNIMIDPKDFKRDTDCQLATHESISISPDSPGVASTELGSR